MNLISVSKLLSKFSPSFISCTDNKEYLLRQWYNLGVEQPQQKRCKLDTEKDVLYGTDSENGAQHQGSDSDQEVLLASDISDCGGSVSGQILVATPSPHSDCGESDNRTKKRSYAKRSSDGLNFLGKSVCVRAHQRLYAVGSAALQKLRRGESAYTKDDRTAEPKHPVLKVSLARRTSRYKWPNILSFFWTLYMSVAEIMPTRLVMPNGKEAAHLVETFAEADPDFQERYASNFLRNLESSFEDVNSAPWTCKESVICSSIILRLPH